MALNRLVLASSAVLVPTAALALTFAVAPAADRILPSEAGPLSVRTIADGLSHPWGLEFLPDGSMLVTEKSGTLRLVSASGALGAPIAGVPEVDDDGQGGLLDVALDPAFAENRLVYLTFSEGGEGGNSTAAGRGTLSADGRQLEDFRVIFSQKPKYDGDKHFGSRIVFDGKGHLFLGLGERSDASIREKAQSLDNHLGKIVRLNLDGSVPADNPFVGREGVLPEIWSYGHRNIQGGALHPPTGIPWFSEHGPKGGDEVNMIEPGSNYGWPLVSFGVNYNGTPVGSGKSEGEGLTAPVHHWTPVIGASGMVFYTGDAVPAWKGSAFFGGLATRDLVRLSLDGTKVTGEERMLDDLGARIRDVRQGPDGAIYVLTDARNGEIIRVAPQSVAAGSQGAG